jgi:hypothetical protein
MGEYAEYAWQSEMRRGFKCKPDDGLPYPRNAVAAHCPHCGKGIRPVAGSTIESMAAHIKAKRCDIAAMEGS